MSTKRDVFKTEHLAGFLGERWEEYDIDRIIAEVSEVCDGVRFWSPGVLDSGLDGLWELCQSFRRIEL